MDIYNLGKTTKNFPVPEEERKKFVLTDKEIIQLAQWAASQGKNTLYQQTLNDIEQWHQQY